MAKKIILQDDFDGTDGARTVPFSFDGKHFEIDLHEENVKKFAEALAPYLEKAQKADPARRRGRGPAAPKATSAQRTARSQEIAKVRNWALSEGLSVSKRGRISAEIMEAYTKANGK